MTFKDSSTQFQIVDLAMLEADAGHPRRNIEEASLKGLVHSIEKLGLIHPLIVRPADTAGRYTVIVGERRRLAAMLAGERSVPVVVRDCDAAQALEVQVFENIGQGVRSALDTRDMANAIQTLTDRFQTQEEAARHFGRAPTWLNQATAAANLSEKVADLLDSGKISSAGTAVRLEKLARKDERRAESLIEQIERLPEGEKISRQAVDQVLAETGGQRKKKEIAPPPAAALQSTPDIVASEEAGNEPIRPARTRVNPGKIRQVAAILGVHDGDEEAVLVRLIDEFLALKNA